MKCATLFAAVIALGCTSAPPQPAGPKYTASGYAISGSAGWEERPGYHGSDLTYLFERKKMLYVVTCAATEASFARYKPEFDKIVRTFRLAP